MAIHSGNFYLTESQMKDNAQYIFDYYISKGWTKNAICGMLGNMQRESSINPGIWQSLKEGNLSGGYGLTQWTPATKYFNWCDERNLPYDDIDSNLSRIDWELANGQQFYPSDRFSETFKEFIKSEESPEYLASCFMCNYERPGDPHEEERRTYARKWFDTLEGGGTSSSFEPRLTDDGIEGEYYWYEGNPFHLAGYSMPNCTTYAWGRFWEISDLADGEKDYSNKPTLPTGDAGEWFDEVEDYETGDIPKLGAVICWSDDGGGAGHVAIVEEIDDDGNITVSQSGWGSSKLFWLSTIYKDDGYSYTGKTFQGFIYNPDVEGEPEEPDPPPPQPKKRKKGFNFILFNRRRRVLQWTKRNF